MSFYFSLSSFRYNPIFSMKLRGVVVIILYLINYFYYFYLFCLNIFDYTKTSSIKIVSLLFVHRHALFICYLSSPCFLFACLFFLIEPIWFPSVVFQHFSKSAKWDWLTRWPPWSFTNPIWHSDTVYSNRSVILPLCFNLFWYSLTIGFRIAPLPSVLFPPISWVNQSTNQPTNQPINQSIKIKIYPFFNGKFLSVVLLLRPLRNCKFKQKIRC